MSAGMAEVIEAHVVTDSGLTENCDVYWRCSCGPLFVTAQTQVRDHIYDHAAHVAEELARAGYGLMPDVSPEYGGPFMGHDGPTDEPFGHGPIRDPHWWNKSTHMRLVGPWRELKPVPPGWQGESNGVD